MHKEQVGNAGKPAERLVFIENNWLLADIAAGHDNRRADLTHQQVVQWRIGQ